MPVNVSQWISTHKQAAAAGGAGLVVVALALRNRSKTTAAAATGAATGTATPGGIGVPGTTATDIQNAVQDQINAEAQGLRTEMAAEIARIPAGKTGATGATGKTGPAGKAPAPPKTPKSPIPGISYAEYMRRERLAAAGHAAQQKRLGLPPKAPTPVPVRKAPPPARKPAPKPSAMPKTTAVTVGGTTAPANKFGMSTVTTSQINGR